MRNREADSGSRPVEWYACYTKGRHEKRVAGSLSDRGLEVFLPLIPRTRQWHDRETVVEFPLFPSYVFVRCGTADLGAAMGTPGLVAVVRFDGRPVAIPDWEIDNIKTLVGSLTESGDEPEPVEMLSRGEQVTVVSGPMAGITGIVMERRRGGRIALAVGVSGIAQGLRIEVDRSAVERGSDQRPAQARADTGRQR